MQTLSRIEVAKMQFSFFLFFYRQQILFLLFFFCRNTWRGLHQRYFPGLCVSKLMAPDDIKRRVIYGEPNIPQLDRFAFTCKASARDGHLLSLVQYHSIRYIIKSCPVTGGGRNAISEWTTITSRVMELRSASASGQCKSNIGCCDTYVMCIVRCACLSRFALRSGISDLYPVALQFAQRIF